MNLRASKAFKGGLKALAHATVRRAVFCIRMLNHDLLVAIIIYICKFSNWHQHISFPNILVKQPEPWLFRSTWPFAGQVLSMLAMIATQVWAQGNQAWSSSALIIRILEQVKFCFKRYSKNVYTSCFNPALNNSLPNSFNIGIFNKKYLEIIKITKTKPSFWHHSKLVGGFNPSEKY